MGEILYHYTDYMALDGILSNGELRLNNVLNMNDTQEMHFFMRGLCQAVTERLKSENLESQAAELQALFEADNRRAFSYSSYAACFSGYRDDAAQWERYGGRGRGVCIAFRRDILEQVIGGPVTLQKVYYQMDLASHPLVEDLYLAVKDCGEPDVRSRKIREVLNRAWLCSAAFKHPSFACENEIRMVVSPFTGDTFYSRPRYHVSVDRIKKYYPLNLRYLCERRGLAIEDLVEEVMIGPESTQSLPILQDYFCDLGMDALSNRIALSECPLRSKY